MFYNMDDVYKARFLLDSSDQLINEQLIMILLMTQLTSNNSRELSTISVRYINCT